MELHHSKHHNTYVTSLNNFSEQMASAQSSQDAATQIALQPLINFHGGGHINHTLFWENLAPSSRGGGGEPSDRVLAVDGDRHRDRVRDAREGLPDQLHVPRVVLHDEEASVRRRRVAPPGAAGAGGPSRPPRPGGPHQLRWSA